MPYTGRPAAHIHFKIHRNNKAVLTTECFVKGYANNEKDNIYRKATATEAGKKLAVDFVPVKDSRIGELAATFDVVLGATPES